MQLQWYPGHMTKAKRAMQEDIKLVDLVIEIVDARVPASSRNPDINALAQNKLRMIVMNKCDLADEAANALWAGELRAKGCYVVMTDARNRGSVNRIKDVIAQVCREKTERDRRRGIVNRPVRAMVVGIPNVGKSTFINSFAGKASAKTGNKPGVTKGNQWIRMNKQVELLDTPGILWPKFEDQIVGLHLALVGSIKDDILNPEELALALIAFLKVHYAGLLTARYHISSEEIGDYTLLEEIAAERGCLMKGNALNTEKAALLLLDDFREGRLGRITLELPKPDAGDEA